MLNSVFIVLVLAAAGAIDARPAPGPAKADMVVCEGGDASSCLHIVAATRALTRMLVTADPAPLRQHLDPRALWISSTGVVRSGAQLIRMVRGDVPRATATLDNVRVRFFDRGAVVTWRESWTSPGAAVSSGTLAGVDMWIRRRGRWAIVATTESSPLAP